MNAQIDTLAVQTHQQQIALLWVRYVVRTYAAMFKNIRTNTLETMNLATPEQRAEVAASIPQQWQSMATDLEYLLQKTLMAMGISVGASVARAVCLDPSFSLLTLNNRFIRYVHLRIAQLSPNAELQPHTVTADNKTMHALRSDLNALLIGHSAVIRECSLWRAQYLRLQQVNVGRDGTRNGDDTGNDSDSGDEDEDHKNQQQQQSPPLPPAVFLAAPTAASETLESSEGCRRPEPIGN